MSKAAVDKTPQNVVLDILAIMGVTSITVASTATVYTDYFALPRNVDFGLLTKITSSGTVNVKVELEQGNSVPNANASDATWAVGQIISAGLVAVGAAALAVAPVVTQFGRLKLTGLGANDASTAFTILQLGTSKKV